jgi:hypothetical protein
MSKKPKKITKKFNSIFPALTMVKELGERKPKIIAHLFPAGEKNGSEWEVMYEEPNVITSEGKVPVEKKTGKLKKEEVCLSMKD